jgi:hypothetical protein
MAKREKKQQRPATMTRKYRSRVAQEQRQIRYIRVGIGAVVVVIVLLSLGGILKTQVVDPTATRRAKEALRDIPAVTVNGTMISIADWQARVRYERQLYINQMSQISQQLSLFDPSTEFGQQLISQGQAQIQELQNLLDLGDGIASDVLNQMVEEQLVRQEAARRGVAVTSEELQSYIEVNLFGYPFPPTPEPFPTLPPPTLAPTATVTPEPTAVPTVPPTPRSLEDFQTSYQQYTEQVHEITGMTEEMWRSMIEGSLLREKLVETFADQVEPSVLQIQGRYIASQTKETVDAYFARLEAGESFDALEQEVQADDSETPAARVGNFDWSTVGGLRDRFGDAFSTVAANTDAGNYAREVVQGLTGQFYLVYVDGKEVRELTDTQKEQQRSELFQAWLDEQKQGEGIVYGNWRDYIPLDPSP